LATLHQLRKIAAYSQNINLIVHARAAVPLQLLSQPPLLFERFRASAVAAVAGLCILL